LNFRDVIRKIYSDWLSDLINLISKKEAAILKFFFIIYGFLSLIKFFTAKVGTLGDPTEKLVFKLYPTLSNVFNLPGEENAENIARYQGKWYFEGNYAILAADEHGFAGENVYFALIWAWWIITLALGLLYFGKQSALIRRFFRP